MSPVNPERAFTTFHVQVMKGVVKLHCLATSMDKAGALFVKVAVRLKRASIFKPST